MFNFKNMQQRHYELESHSLPPTFLRSVSGTCLTPWQWGYFTFTIFFHSNVFWFFFPILFWVKNPQEKNHWLFSGKLNEVSEQRADNAKHNNHNLAQQQKFCKQRLIFEHTVMFPFFLGSTPNFTYLFHNPTTSLLV